MSKLYIRPAGPANAFQIVAGINAVCAERVYFHTAQYKPTPAWEVALRTPDAAPDHLLLIAGAEGQFAGAVNLFPETAEPSASRAGELGIFVLKPFRGQDIGTALMDALLKQARASSYTRIVLSVLTTNLRAIHLYRKFGFTVENQRRREYAFLGEQDELIMAKSLDGCGCRGVEDV
jgi:ribosomal protein S18 acetylase RimI-like enzyme